MDLHGRGIVLRQTKIAGGRRMLELFTREYGVISCGSFLSAAGGSKRKSSGHLALQPFTLGSYRIREEKGRYTVKSAEAERSFYGLAEDPDRYGEAAFVLELTARLLPEGVPQPRIFDLMTDMFSALENRRNRFLTLRLAYEVKLMDLLGVAPRTDCCVRCGKKNGLEAFSVPGGGALCGECHRKLTEEGYPDRLIYPARFDMINVIDYFRSNPLKRFEKLALNDGAAAWMQNVIRRYMAYYLDVDQLKSEAAMNQEGMLQWKSH